MRYFHTYIEVTMSRRGTPEAVHRANRYRAPPLLFGTQLALYRIACQFGDGVQIEFAHQIASVGNHGGGRDLQSFCDLRGCAPHGDELKDLPLASADAGR